MTLELLAKISAVLAAVPAFLFLINLLFYRRLPSGRRRGDATIRPAVSVLIPARDEERNIAATLAAVLANRTIEMEVIVLDDHSTDRTAALVAEAAARDRRVRLETAPALPAGWCGKQHACHVLALRARHPFLVFLDADVRLASDAIERMVDEMVRSKVSLSSGVPRQITGTGSERLLLPMIHFVLMGFLPMPFMRWTRRPGFSAGCGQLFIAEAGAYRQTGGHAMIRESLHDGIKLPRIFRRAGFATGLFDATDVASCRMYQGHAETWRGLAKNATEGLGAPGTILPMTLLLVGGQVVPFAVLFKALAVGASSVLGWAALGCFLAILPRVIGAWRFRQGWAGLFLHPLGVFSLMLIQWWALFRMLAGRSAVWKGRSYGPMPAPQTARTA